MKKRWRWSERKRLWLTLEFAVVLPAAALIAFSVLHLKSIQRDHAVEAAIQRDFNEVLAISDKRIGQRANELVAAVREQFPTSHEACEQALEHVLASFPYVGHVFEYNPDWGLVLLSQPGKMDDPDFRAEATELEETVNSMHREYGSMTKMLADKLQKAEAPFYFFPNWVPRKNGDYTYQAVAVFLVPGGSGRNPTIGGMAFDNAYLRNEFFPKMLNEMMSRNIAGSQQKAGANDVAMMVHVRGETSPLAASAGWNNGKPDVERRIETAFPGLVLSMKLCGTTLEALAHRFLRSSYLILGGLSVVMAAGILLTYRNVSKEMALAKLKSDFVSNVSHELRTPLSLIRLYAETLEMGRLSNQEKRQEYYCIMRKESERLSALINNILDFSRIEAGKKEYDFRETDVAALVRNTLESYRYQIEQQGFAFQQNIADNLPMLRVDREALARSLLNLVNNALKYSQKEKYLGVNLYRENGAMKLEVIDHGIGIPRSEQRKIFEKFYRAGDPLVHTTKGTGLGLCLVRHIVEAHGGDISVESAPGQGSRFTIVLPVPGSASAAVGGAA